MWGNAGESGWTFQRTRLNIPYTSKIFAVSEASPVATAMGNNYKYRTDQMDAMYWPHANKANFLFFDGHVDHTERFLVYSNKPSGWMWNHRDPIK
jgi:prepilin-type processing-associated H-X9-DG protein